MDCQTAQAMFVAALLAGEPVPGEAGTHVASCQACAEEVQGLDATWTALAALPALEPSPDVARRLSRRIRRESVREAVASIESWQRAALAGVAGFALSLVLALVLPYERLVTLCRAIAPDAVPAAGAYLVAGLLYGLLPMAIVEGLQGGRGRALAGFVGVLEAAIVFLVVVVPYVVVVCGFPPPLLAGFVGGIALGALAGGAAGVGLRRRMA